MVVQEPCSSVQFSRGIPKTSRAHVRHSEWQSSLLLQMDMDPTVNINWGAPVRLPRYSLEDMFETESQHLKEALGIESEEEWQVRRDWITWQNPLSVYHLLGFEALTKLSTSLECRSLGCLDNYAAVDELRGIRIRFGYSMRGAAIYLRTRLIEEDFAGNKVIAFCPRKCTGRGHQRYVGNQGRQGMRPMFAQFGTNTGYLHRCFPIALWCLHKIRPHFAVVSALYPGKWLYWPDIQQLVSFGEGTVMDM